MICKIMSEEVVDRGEAPPRYAEQITRDQPKETLRAAEQEVSSSKNKVKDPKKVAAGKKLAEYNKKAKEALVRETLRAAEQMKREETLRAAEQKIKREEYQNENTESESKAWLPELSFTTVLSIVGIGFTAFDMFMRYRQIRRTNSSEKEDNKNRIPDLTQVPQILQQSNIATPPARKLE